MFSFVLGFMCVHIISSIIHRVYKHEILMRQPGLVVFPFGCVLSCWVVPWVFCGLVGPGSAAASAGTGRAAAAPASGCLLVWRLGGAGAPPATFADARQPNRGLEHAPARAAICSGHLHRHQGMLPLAPSRRPPLPRQRGIPAAEADGNSGLLISNRTAAGAGTRPYPCAWAS